jgi:hypothetical protein
VLELARRDAGGDKHVPKAHAATGAPRDFW